GIKVELWSQPDDAVWESDPIPVTDKNRRLRVLGFHHPGNLVNADNEVIQQTFRSVRHADGRAYADLRMIKHSTAIANCGAADAVVGAFGCKLSHPNMRAYSTENWGLGLGIFGGNGWYYPRFFDRCARIDGFTQANITMVAVYAKLTIQSKRDCYGDFPAGTVVAAGDMGGAGAGASSGDIAWECAEGGCTVAPYPPSEITPPPGQAWKNVELGPNGKWWYRLTKKYNWSTGNGYCEQVGLSMPTDAETTQFMTWRDQNYRSWTGTGCGTGSSHNAIKNTDGNGTVNTKCEADGNKRWIWCVSSTSK
ncbi:MAG: hypothetical protein AAGC55_01300, partial [Myxococcota bacterium]